MGAAKIVGLLVLIFIINDWKLLPFSVSSATTNCTNSSHGGVHCKSVPYGPVTLEQSNNVSAVGLKMLDTNCKQLAPTLSPNATINSTATLSIRAVDPNKLLLPGPAVNGTQLDAHNGCQCLAKATTKEVNDSAAIATANQSNSVTEGCKCLALTTAKQVDNPTIPTTEQVNNTTDFVKIPTTEKVDNSKIPNTKQANNCTDLEPLPNTKQENSSTDLIMKPNTKQANNATLPTTQQANDSKALVTIPTTQQANKSTAAATTKQNKSNAAPRPIESVCKNPGVPTDFLTNNDKKTCKAINASATEAAGDKRMCRVSCNKSTNKPKCRVPQPRAAGEPDVPQRAANERRDDECYISDIEETMVMATCASCSARANVNGVGVTLTCFDCHHIPADKTCHYSKYDPKMKVSAKFFELAEYSGRGNVSEPAPTPTDDKKQKMKK